MINVEAIKLAKQLIKENNLTCKVEIKDVYSWTGCYTPSKNTIYLSKYLLQNSTDKEIKNVILHEIAHALVGIKHHHDKVWKQKCIEIGGTGVVSGNLDRNTANLPFKYKLVCTHCGKEYMYLKKPSEKIIKYGRCNKCHNKVELIKL